MTVPNFAGKTSQKAAVCHGAMDLRVEDKPVRPPAEGEAQVAMGVTGLCGSDRHLEAVAALTTLAALVPFVPLVLMPVHYYAHGANGVFKIREPLVLGHESCGVITALPDKLPEGCKLAVGDRVALEVGVSCKNCKFCKEGRYNLCTGMRFASSAKTFPHLDGTLCEVMNHPLDLLHKLPPSLDLPLAALAEPLSVVLHAWRRANLQPAARILVIGAGAVGLLACALAKASGATTVVAVDIEQGKLDFAREMGWADATFTLPRGPRVSGAEALETAKANWDALKASPAVADSGVDDLDQGFDCVFECTGVEVCMQLACFAAVSGGKVMFVGMGTATMALPAAACLLREVDLHGVFRYCNTYPDALALLGSGKLGDVGKMVTQRYPLEQAVEAFEDVKRGKDKDGNTVIKVMVGNLDLK